jgi:hypothetical protein
MRQHVAKLLKLITNHLLMPASLPLLQRMGSKAII